ncbi:hypothetical protein EYF80_004320 [Liparis tanakae]|uniref:Uncharacterized protein n=1 Tax=Liparis tanakae TaxID=230148 RepID=A0A4Z2J6M2_9TELE|nr:hypothetical protein EYF80_004320 [Liparis tanakae]
MSNVCPFCPETCTISSWANPNRRIKATFVKPAFSQSGFKPQQAAARLPVSLRRELDRNKEKITVLRPALRHSAVSAVLVGRTLPLTTGDGKYRSNVRPRP